MLDVFAVTEDIQIGKTPTSSLSVDDDFVTIEITEVSFVDFNTGEMLSSSNDSLDNVSSCGSFLTAAGNRRRSFIFWFRL